jgi:hypothetical protein
MVSFYSYDTQHPQYGKIRNSKLDKGDFIFSFKKYQQTASAKQDLVIKLDSCHVVFLKTYNHEEATKLLEALVNEGIKNIFIESVFNPKNSRNYYNVRSISFQEVKAAVIFRSNPIFYKPEIYELMMRIPAQVKCE